MDKAKDKFYKQINEMIMTQKYDEDAMEKLLNMIVVLQILAKKEKNEEFKKKLIHAGVVGESLAKRLYALKAKQDLN